MIRRPPRSTLDRSSAASDVYKRQGIVSKSSNPSHKQKILYRLTQKGIDLVPVLIEVIMWSAKYDKDSAVDMKFVKSVKRDKLGLISKISNRLVEELGVS